MSDTAAAVRHGEALVVPLVDVQRRGQHPAPRRRRAHGHEADLVKARRMRAHLGPQGPGEQLAAEAEPQIGALVENPAPDPVEFCAAFQGGPRFT